MTGVQRHTAEHRLNVREGCSPIKQKKKGASTGKEQSNPGRSRKVGWLPTAGDRLESRISLRIPLQMFPGRVQGMPFGLKNAGATYQRLVDRAFQKQIRHNLEVYVDDLVIKSHTEEEIIRDIEETFKTLRQINMKLNPKKCTFGMQEEMFLGYKVNAEGLKVCPDKADAVLSLPSPGCRKDVQKLNGKIASLNRFLSKSPKKSLPFFKTLKKCTQKSDFQWTQEVRIAFKQMNYQPSLNDRKGRQAIASVLCEPCPTKAGDQLHLHGKIGISLTQCKQTAKKVFLGTYNYCNYRSADKAIIVKIRDHREDAKGEHL
ncbi:reverse transcriptase domain-containing protein [Tanacetum coccineum]